MRIKEITVHRAIKHALPGYGSIEAGSGITIEVEKGENLEKVWNWAWLETQTQIIKKMAEQFKSQDWQEKLKLVEKEREELNGSINF